MTCLTESFFRLCNANAKNVRNIFMNCSTFFCSTLIKMKPVNIGIKRNNQIVFRRITNYLVVLNDFELDLINFIDN